MQRFVSISLALAVSAGAAQSQSFSLDDNPSFPLTSAPFAGLFSAEDPFGLFLPAVGLGRIGPSPTLITASGVVYVDGDVLTISPVGGPFEPVLDVKAPLRSYLDALSADHERFNAEVSQEMNIRFSVDRATTGLPGTPLSVEAGFNQQPGDIYISERLFPNPGIFAGLLPPGPFAGVLPTAVPGLPGMHRLEFDESRLFLTAGLGPGNFLPPMVPAPPIAPGEHDNVDAFNILPDPTIDLDGDAVNDIDMFYSIPPADAFVTGLSAADILAVPKGVGMGVPFPWAPAPFMGLDSFGFPPNPQLELFDDIDGLVVWDFGDLNPDAPAQSTPEPGRDYALFSLSEASASLVALRGAGFPVDGSTIFFTDFTGAFAIYLFGGQIGVEDISFSDNTGRNIDALEICAMVEDPCDPCVLADVNGDGVVSPADFAAWVAAYNAGDIRADQNCDGLVTAADFAAWVANYNLCI